jgi:phage terminase large subunit
MLTEQENKEWYWWFFDFYDNVSMTEKRIERIKEACAGNKRDWDSRVLGIRSKTESLAFPGFDDEKNVISLNELDYRFKITKQNGKEHEPEHRFRVFYAGLDTSFSSKTNDLIALVFIGITDNNEIYVLDEFTYNNRDHTDDDKLTASKLCPIVFEFLHKNSKKWGIPRYIFVDEADANTILELTNYKRQHCEPFSIAQSKKSKFPIPTRMKLINNLIATNKYCVAENCITHIHEMNVMSVDPHDISRPADANNHTYDALCYAIEIEYLKNKL